MKIYIDGHNFRYEIENICRLFFPNEKFDVMTQLDNIDYDSDYIITKVILEGNSYKLKARVRFEGSVSEKAHIVKDDFEDVEDECERKLALILFNCLSEVLNIQPPWGIITGVRPVKLMRKLIKQMGIEKACLYFKDEFNVSKDKIDLCLKTLKEEEEVLKLSDKKSFSLYISIPFCKTRCSYCSFVSQSIERAHNLIPNYVDLLCKEIIHTSKLANDIGLNLQTVYIGGGTPTTLNAQQMQKLLYTIINNFNMDTCREFTVEAGRPDTINEEILKVIKDNNVTRISINPQTFNDKVLEAVGRKHTSKQTIDAFSLARQYGFKNINMDIIAGLPTDTIDSFKETIDRICLLDPESITIHTLSIKKAADLTKKGKKLYSKDSVLTSQMLDYAYDMLRDNRYIPYYLYRQSRMAGNNENTGWSKPNYKGLYNIYVMDETHTILACGAGAVSKLKSIYDDSLERIFNYKFPYEYMSDFEEIIRRKDKVKTFYDKFY